MSANRPKPAEIAESLRFQKNLLMLMRQGRPSDATPASQPPERQLQTLVRALAPAARRS
ncbi:MAG: hypothetical protein KJZ84_10885 [Bryobacteraceae bacterium]|nr:hypothetical protein [Bryobacteraceae bacterium]